MTDANEITNIVFSALSDRKGFDDWFDQIDEELQAEIKAEIAEALAALRVQPDDNDEYIQGYKNGVKREAEIWRERLDAERQRSVHIEAMNRNILEHVANLESITKPAPMILMAAQPNHIVDASEMVDHSELVKRLRYYATRGMDAYVVAADCDRAADALEAIGETK